MKITLLGSIVAALLTIGGITQTLAGNVIGKNKGLSHAWISNKVKGILNIHRPDYKNIVTALLNNKVAIVPWQAEVPVRVLTRTTDDDALVLHDSKIIQTCLAHDCAAGGHILMVSDGKLNHRSFRLEQGTNNTSNEQWVQVIFSDATTYKPKVALFNTNDYINDGISSIDIILQMMVLTEVQNMSEFVTKLGIYGTTIRRHVNGEQTIPASTIEQMATNISQWPDEHAAKNELLRLVSKLKATTAIESQIAKIANIGRYLNPNQHKVLQIRDAGIKEYLKKFGKEVVSFNEEVLQNYNKNNASSADILMQMIPLMGLKSLAAFARLVDYGSSIISEIMYGKSFITNVMISKMEIAINSLPTPASKTELTELLDKLRVAVVVERRIAKVEALGGYDMLTTSEKIAMQIKRRGIENYRSRPRRKSNK